MHSYSIGVMLIMHVPMQTGVQSLQEKREATYEC
jgi:hypothetical protein